MALIFLCLTYFTYYAFQVHPCCHKWQGFIVLMAKSYPLVYIHPVIFIHSSISGYQGCFYVLAIGKQRPGEHRGACIFFELVFWGFFSSIHTSGIARSYGSSNFNFLRKLHTTQRLHQSTTPPSMRKGSDFSTGLVSCCFFEDSHIHFRICQIIKFKKQ